MEIHHNTFMESMQYAMNMVIKYGTVYTSSAPDVISLYILPDI